MLKNLKIKPIYRTHKDSIDKDFYVPCFSESIQLNRAVGFFSLHSLTLSIDGVIRFIRNNGQINLICSPDLSQTDAELIDACVSLDKEHITKSLIETILNCKPSEEEIAQLDIICNMISEGRMKIKIAYQSLGIYHEKFGIFIDDEEDMVYFTGSLNETKRAFKYNHESIQANCSWQSEFTAKTIHSELHYFNNLWNNKEEAVIVMDFPQAVEKRLLNNYKRSETLEKAIDGYIRKHIQKNKKTLFSYQEDAINQFLKNEGQHFYEMATGTGKTFTAIKTIEHLRKLHKDKKFVIICVPQIDLQTQWEDSLHEEGFEKVYLFGGAGSNFDRTIAEAMIAFQTGNEDIIAVSVYDTFFSRMHQRIKLIKPLFLIVDEAHNLTKGQLSIVKGLNPFYRLGLSATIQRYNEEESKSIAKFFTPGETFYYGIEDAINNGFLSKYEYHPLFIHLTEDENDKFNNKSRQLAQELNKDDKDEELIDRLRRERSLILKQATNKIIKLQEMITQDYDFINSVVYCGQGRDEEGETIINNVTGILYQKGLVVSQFTSRTQDRKRVLYEFEHGYFDTLVAIKCFDEGVDVPKLDKIYIMASDSALRQTVQRRGRVLRKCKESGKTIAHIFDMIVLPAIEQGTYGGEGLLKIELARAKEYNRLAVNRDDNERAFNDLEKTYHITLNENNYEKESD